MFSLAVWIKFIITECLFLAIIALSNLFELDMGLGGGAQGHNYFIFFATYEWSQLQTLLFNGPTHYLQRKWSVANPVPDSLVNN